MTQPRYEFWRTITPVLGEPIPSSAEFCETNDEWWHSAHNRFAEDDFGYDWRVPVEVIPLEVAVEALLCAATVDRGKFSVWTSRKLIADSRDELKVIVTEYLRKAAK